VRQFVQHQLRWSRTIRDARPWGYVGLLLTFGLPWALATLLAAHGAGWAWLLFALTVAVRLAVAFVSARVALRDRQILRDFFLLPLRDLIAPVVWAMSFAGNRISWRGDLFDLKNGRLARVHR
jgi:ceramide glucosyltransferase